MNTEKRRKKNIYGGVGLRVIVCAVSLIALGLAIFTMLKTFETGKADDYREATRLSEYGLQEAFKKLAATRDWSTGFEDEPFEDGGRYAVSFDRHERGGALFLTVTSTGTSGSVVQKTERTLRLHVTAEGDTMWISDGAAPVETGPAVMEGGDSIGGESMNNADIDAIHDENGGRKK